MNAPFNPPEIDTAEALMMDAARRIQLSPTRHEIARTNFNALCKHVDREGSPLAGKVVQCYPSGSFSIGTAILSHVSTAQHDVDVVVELNFPPFTKPALLLEMLYQAINGEKGSRYHGQVRKNSRCVTVIYEDKTTVDLMPVVRLPDTPERAGNLFHSKPETGEEYHKPVNPWGFAEDFNNRTEVMTSFAEAFRANDAAMLAKALTEPLPEHVPLAEKSPRVVALQLAKRARDISYRRRDRKLRKPPSVLMAGVSLEMGPVQPRLIDELIAWVDHMAAKINAATYRGERFRFFNPAYRPDEFTDRWPENIEAQKLYAADLRQFKAALLRLRDDDLSPEQIKSELEILFGESVAVGVVSDLLEKRAVQASAGKLRFGPAGRILTGAAAASTISRTARATTFEGGELPQVKTIAEQIAAMHTEHPNFQLGYEDARAAIWQGRLAPSRQRSYLVEVTYKTPIMGEMFTIGRVQPRVRVLDPKLERHPDYEEGPIPHVYWDQDDRDHPVLCLFSLEGKEWTLDDLIAETTIYWVARWLYFYEGWLATKMWKGGGRHPGRRVEAKPLETV